MGERLLQDLQIEIQHLLFEPTRHFRPRMENIIRDWLVRNASHEFRTWNFTLNELQNEGMSSTWTANITLDNETIEIQFTVNT